MNRLLLMIVLGLVLSLAPKAMAANSPYPNPYRQTLWNDITDGVHTFGQSPQQKHKTLKKLHALRTRNRFKDINQDEQAKFLARNRHLYENQNL